jgi:hypothetical protein
MMQVVFGSACAFMPWFEGFLVMRFFTAAAVGGSMITSFVICKYICVGKYFVMRTHDIRVVLSDRKFIDRAKTDGIIPLLLFELS